MSTTPTSNMNKFQLLEASKSVQKLTTYPEILNFVKDNAKKEIKLIYEWKIKAFEDNPKEYLLNE